jgi:hypothetical protein
MPIRPDTAACSAEIPSHGILNKKQAGKTTTTNRHTQETKGTNEHDKKEPKKGTAISLKTSINTRKWPNSAETCCVILKFKV